MSPRPCRLAGRRRSERGAVTAELAMALPLLVAVTVGLVWLLAVGAAQVRVTDAARETARAAARGDSDADAAAIGARVAPAGASVALSRSGDRVTVTVRGEVAGPGGLFGFLPGATVDAEAVALAEAPS
ncbi:MAG: hypothetical protein CMH83_11185 [Nocardioides sp.]|nr:hypothetical protein [Nocardioides sp.]